MKILIIGAGEVGFDIVNRLSGVDHDITLIEIDPERCEWVKDQLDVIVVNGDGSNIQTLKDAGVQQSDLVIAVTGQDNTNLVACMLAHQFGVPKKIARVMRYTSQRQDSTRMLQQLTTIDSLINPASETAEEIRELFEYTWATDVVTFANGQVQLVGTRITAASPMVGKTLNDLVQDQEQQRFVLVALNRKGSTLIPRGDTRLQENDLVFLLGKKESVSSIVRQVGKEDKKAARVMIVGGGQVGFQVAKRLEQMKVYTILIEKDRERCWELAQQLTKTRVIHGDGTDVKLLKSEYVTEIDHFVAATGDEETNVIMSLLVEQYNPPCKTICLVKRAEYIPLVLAIGVDAAVSSRVVTINAIMKYIRRGEVVSVATLKESQAEIIEIIAAAHSPVTGRPLRELKFPDDAIIGTMVRGEEIIIPDGNSVVQPGDKVIVFALPDAIEDVEKLFVTSPTDKLVRPLWDNVIKSFKGK
jgi:trk system potassium uptake protein TrkA